MKLAPRFLVNLCASLHVRRFARQQKRLGRGSVAQRETFAELMRQAGGTEFANLHGLQADTSYEQFRDKVPVRTYDWFDPFIRRMAAGEEDVLVKGRCPFFVETAGATGANQKLLPVPGPQLAHFRQGLQHALFLQAQRAGHSRVFLGKHLHVGASISVLEYHGSYRTSLDGILTLCLTPWAETHLRAPTSNIAEMPEGAAKIEAIARSMIGRDVTLIAGTPGSTSALSAAARDFCSTGKKRITHLQAVWPNLHCFLHTGAPLGFFGDGLRETLGPTVTFHEVYAAAEGIIAAQDIGKPTGLRVLSDTGIFFEFLPLALFHEANLAKMGPHCVPLERVEEGVDYVPILTTPAGLFRYALTDIVRFVPAEIPRLQFVGRVGLHLNSAGEQVTEREVLETLQTVCIRNGWQAIACHVAPYEQRFAAGQVASAHEWWLELRTHTIKTPTANVLGPEFDAELSRRNPHYAACRQKNLLGAPVIRLVMPGVFESWGREQRKTASASKMPRCRPDRLVADQLAALAPFHQATIAPTRGARLPV